MSRRNRRGSFFGNGNRGGVATWSALYGAAPTDVMLTITQPVILDIDALVHGLEIEGAGELIFDPNTSRLLQVDQQRPVCVMDGGHLEMIPASASITHELRFIDVDESLFTAGGGMNHTANPGLCVENATVTLRGATKTAWTHATSALVAGATSCTVVDASGWRIGDEIVITPTEDGAVALQWTHFDRRTITNIVGNVLTFAALSYPHPANTVPSTGELLYAEVLNLTRNVKVGGQDATHRAQTMFMEDCTGTILEHFEGRYLGPRQDIPSTAFTNGVLGRYGLHFHLMDEGSRDIHVLGVVLHDMGFRGFVPHGSHGMTFTDCVVWDFFSDGFWWDTTFGAPENPEDYTNDLLWDHCVAGCGRFSRANPEGRANSSFGLSAGANVTIQNCLAIAHHGYIDAAGYVWSEELNHDPFNVWNFFNNDAHNNRRHGIFIWQNDSNLHDINGFRGWNNDEMGIHFGAYFNPYQMTDIECWGNGFWDMGVKIQSRQEPEDRLVKVTRKTIQHVRILHHTSEIATPERPVVFTDVDILDVTVDEDGNPPHGGYEDFINCGLAATDVIVIWMHTDSVIRIQTGASAWKVTSPDTTTRVITSIPLFA